MTVTYTAEVATCRGFGCFLKLLLRWRGSIYKLVWLDLVSFLTLYYALNITYRFILDAQQKTVFESIVKYCYNYSDLIPLSFVLGFYVSIVMTRWWNQYVSIPWPDPIAVFVSANIHGQDERGRVMRRTVMRYACLCLTMVFSNISPRVKKRFPELQNFVDAGLLNENEKTIMENMNKSFPRHSKHWLPIVWATSIITRARKEGRIRDDFAVKTFIDELNVFRGKCGLLISYDTISVPLVYTQVVTLAVYSFFICSVMAQQWTERPISGDNFVNRVDLYFPVFTTLQFFFYMGWLKVAESLINPFGEDDDDFEVNWMVDRNLQVSYLIVDEMHHDHPELLKDQYWDEIFPNELPYTLASERFREEHPQPSTAKIEVSKTAAMPTTLSSVRIDEMVGKDAAAKLSASTQHLAQQQQQQQAQAQAQAHTQDRLPNLQPMQTVNYKFPDQLNDEEADDASGIHFTAGNGKVRQGSSPSLVSLSGTLSRVNTVASALKRFLSREDSRPGSTTPNDELNPKYRFPASASSASLSNATGVAYTKPAIGSMRITDQVIEEVDEQTTITSQRGGEPRADVRGIFGSGPSSSKAAPSSSVSSQPIDIPPRRVPYSRAQSTRDDDAPSLFPPGGVDALLSSSAPMADSSRLSSTVPSSPTSESTKSLYERAKEQRGSRETVEDLDIKASTEAVAPGPAPVPAAEPEVEGDDFDKLKAARNKERQEKQRQKLVRTISQAPIAQPTMSAVVPVDPAAVDCLAVAGGGPATGSLTQNNSSADMSAQAQSSTNPTTKSLSELNQNQT